jgi:uncharacterized membrane protein
MSTPAWVLTLAYWLHMLATVVWIGGLAALALLALPAAKRALDSGKLEAQAYSSLLRGFQRRLDPIGWFSLALLAGTGLLQMSASPHYEGFLAVGNRWAVAILAKHLVIFLMVAVSAYMTWGLLPGLERAALLRSRGVDAPKAARLERREINLLRLNLLLGGVVLALTAVARAVN